MMIPCVSLDKYDTTSDILLAIKNIVGAQKINKKTLLPKALW